MSIFEDIGKDEQSEMILYYYKNPYNNQKPLQYDLTQKEGNKICGDDVTIYINRKKTDINTKAQSEKTIKSLHFNGNTSLITTAAASLVAELAEGEKISTILLRDYQTLEKEGFKVSEKRKRAAVITLLAIRNARHKHIQDNKNETFEDIL